MIREINEWDNAKNEIILYKLKPGKKSPLSNPYYYDKNILEEFYVAHRISTFPEIAQTRLLSSEEYHAFGLFVKNKLPHEILNWPLLSDVLGISYVCEKHRGLSLPKIYTDPKFFGIRPALVLQEETIDNIKFEAGDLLFCGKLFDDPLDPEVQFQQMQFFSALSNNLLLCDEYIGKTKFDPFLSDCSEINKMIDEWYIRFVDYFGFQNI